ncbi:formin-like protein 2 [Rutidosis leptorrhynchoides]|uniref:formin-like protein 2 n=1 Tax=Rutidosis leptorrhynchoides TaxID=125765 RepID=UPI003A9A013E
MMSNIIFLLFIIFSLFISHTSTRRILHQPFFPDTYSPPPQPPITTTQPPITTIQPPSLSPQPQPKHPFSSLQPPSTTTHHHHFFPFFTTPTSPTTITTIPSTSLPTFPANISTIIIPQSSKSHVSKKLLFLSLTLTLFSIIIITTIVTTLLYHRHHKLPPQTPSSDNHRLFPANQPISDKPSPPPSLPPNFSTPSSEFLYLGTLVSPIHDQNLPHKTFFSATTSGGYDRMGSPELHPLPPLPRQDFHHKKHNMNIDDSCFTDSDVESQPQPISQIGKTTMFPPPPPPMPAARLWEPQKKEEIIKPKLRGLHWDKVNTSSDKAMVWDQLKCSTFQLNEEMIETLFMDKLSKVAPNHKTNQPMAQTMAAADSNQMKRVLDPHKSRNIAILLRAFNLTIDEVCDSILQGNVDTLGSELLGSLLKMAPTTEEEVRLKELNDASLFELDPAEKFLKAVIGIPFAFKRVDAMLYVSSFDSEIEYLEGSFQIIKSACQQLRNSRMFIKLLQAVLLAGNRMNIGTSRGDAHAFKLDTLLKLIDVKGIDGKTTLLHFVVHEITRAEGCRLLGKDHNLQSELCDEVEFTKRGLEVVSGLSGELSSVKKAATMEIDLLLKEVRRLVMGLNKIREVVDLNERFGPNERFSDSMNSFLKKAEGSIGKIEGEERVSISMVKETTEYFHGSSTMEDSQSLWIFKVVRDFLLVLDRVCKEVGKINERTTVRSQKCSAQFS